MPRDESPKTKEKNLKKLNVKGSRKQLLDQLSRKQLDQLEALHLEHSGTAYLITYSGRSVRRDDAYRVPETVFFFAVSAQQHRVTRNPLSETAHTAQHRVAPQHHCPIALQLSFWLQ